MKKILLILLVLILAISSIIGVSATVTKNHTEYPHSSSVTYDTLIINESNHTDFSHSTGDNLVFLCN